MKKIKTNLVLSKIDYLKRHAFTILPYVTPLKLFNAARSEILRILGRSHLHSFPYFIKIEPSSICQMNCPGCESAKFSEKCREKEWFLDPSDLDKIINPIQKYLLGVSLSFIGEPLLNERIAELIESLHKKKIAVTFPTNLSLEMSEERMVSLIKSGVDCIFVSLDGATRETYTKYRVNGNFELVLKNVAQLVAIRNQLRMKRPKIIWKFIIFDHNKSEIDTVKNDYNSKYSFDSVELNFDYRNKLRLDTLKNRSKSLLKKKKACYWTWNSMVVRSNGDILPCCNILDPFGNALKQSIPEIWNNEKYKKLRSSFQNSGVTEGNKNEYCENCEDIL